MAQRFQIRDYALLERLVAYVFSTSGNLFSVKSTTNYLKSVGMRASCGTLTDTSTRVSKRSSCTVDESVE